MNASPIYVRVSRAPEVFDISVATIYRLAQRGAITIHKRGGSSWIKVAEVSAYIEGLDGEAAA